MDAKALLEKLHLYSQAHRVLVEKEDQAMARRLCETVHYFLEDQAKRVVQQSEGNALLYWYSNDGTPLLTRETSTRALPNKVVMRRAGSGQEFLLQRAFLKTTDSEGSPVVAALVKPPLPLTEGKTAWN
eukprot:3880786-Lingulodinium_polyedra.AAC.1